MNVYKCNNSETAAIGVFSYYDGDTAIQICTYSDIVNTRHTFLTPTDARAFAADVIAACDQIEGVKP